MQIQEVKDRLALQIPAGRKMTAEEFLSIFPKPMKLSAGVGQAMGNVMGIKVKKRSSRPCHPLVARFLSASYNILLGRV
jgi:hypothetical protein